MSRFNSIGTDVEIFAFSNAENIHKSLCGLIGGTKEKPKQVENLPNGFALQEDNVSVEYNIPSCRSLADWKIYNKVILEHITKTLAGLDFVVSKDASASFLKTELTHPNSLVFGCEPDYDAWKKIENKKPTCDNPFLRTAGGHIHVGTNQDMITGIQQMDLHLGVPSILLDTSESSQQRRTLYGKAGAMRPKPYGFEYRVLSNFWIFSEELLSWVYQQTVNSVTTPQKIKAKDALAIQNTINTGDQNAAKDIITYYGLAMPSSYKRG